MGNMLKDDLISRLQVFDEIKLLAWDKFTIDDSYEYYLKALEDVEDRIIRVIPSAHPGPRWIPCYEKLPEKGQICIISSYGKVSTAYYTGNYPGEWFDHRGIVDAWMPFPDPYKGDV